jgi:hypothetical protein
MMRLVRKRALLCALMAVALGAVGGSAALGRGSGNLVNSPGGAESAGRVVQTATTGPPRSPFPLHRAINATFFWVGEPAGPDNGFIANTSSAWEGHWMQNFGGIDDPNARAGFLPAGFTPTENPFYVALPYDDLDAQGGLKPSAARIPWFGQTKIIPGQSIVKNRWVRIINGNKVVYAQWEDTGPFQYNDFGYVFRNHRPVNRINQSAGIDVSPAVRDALGIDGLSTVDWQFVNQNDVPAGPWRQILTTTGVTP